ncbi:MAG TPA: heavy-metal-associated domain-containing protein [Gammaproteobacteria bacterium]|nr:heavy-metal-associated domain-containing protein [Gammaproteobacteria bacterium]MBT3488968.1 heavy-metal-associated domain-containing protein [Gammaproteobacteria bacterium]MBT3717323.1 heavy-metal-associated domain-containing protein [Gammaproteobacteria bacterium]MBT3844723.1 heavy-metal-associated domain-containing protein [Gammaproteobacteria bacterium]MBT4300865.1 heavy-metal-associated domain-containing protein [Gammaproteobacteria bacterium]
MKQTIEVENIKCGGCAHTIEKKLNELFSLRQIEIDIEQGTVRYEHESEAALSTEVEEALLALGYPKRGSVEGLGNVKAKAVSFVSCAIGRIDK